MARWPAGTAAAVVVWILGLVHLVAERAARSVLLDHRRVLHRFLFELPQPSAGVARQFRNFAGRFETTGGGRGKEEEGGGGECARFPRNWSHSRRKGGGGVRYHYTAIGLVSGRKEKTYCVRREKKAQDVRMQIMLSFDETSGFDKRWGCIDKKRNLWKNPPNKRASMRQIWLD